MGSSKALFKIQQLRDHLLQQTADGWQVEVWDKQAFRGFIQEVELLSEERVILYLYTSNGLSAELLMRGEDLCIIDDRNVSAGVEVEVGGVSYELKGDV